MTEDTLNAPGSRELPWYRPPLERVAYGLWILFALAIAARVVFRASDWNGVFIEFHGSAQGWLQRKDIYSGDLEFRYPPIAVLFLLPFSFLGEIWGSVLWRWLNLAVYVGSLLWAFAVPFPSEMKRLAKGGILLLLLPLSITSLNNAQVNGMVVGLLIASAIALREKRYPLSALLATVPVAFKLYPIVFAMVVGVLYPRRFLPWFVLFVGIAAALPFACSDPGYVARQYRQLYDAIRLDDRTSDIALAYRDLRLVLAVFGTPVSEHFYLAIQALAGTGIAAIALVGQRRGWSDDRLLGFVLGLVCCWMTVLGPATEKATYILVAPVLTWLLIEAVRDRRRGQFRLLVVLYALSLVPVVVVGKAFFRAGPVRIALPLATIALLAYLFVRAWRELRTTTPA